MNEAGLLKLKQKIDDAKQSSSELKGQQTALLQQLKGEYKCNSINEAKLKLKEVEGQITKLDEKIDKGLKELEEKYDK